MADQWDEATRKLIELTEAGDLTWHPEKLSGDRTEDERIVGPAYVTELKGKRIAVYEVRVSPRLRDELPEGAYVSKTVVVEFVNAKNELEWRWPGPDRRWQLLDAIQYQVSNGESFLRSLLHTAS